MIASISGRVRHVGLDRVVVEVGGVGMLAHTTPATAAACRHDQTVTLATTLVVREDSLTLYGFAEADERDMFETVQTVSGVGPRLALAMVSVLTPDQIRAAVTTGDLVTLTKVPGVGKKGAERMVLELRDTLRMPPASAASTPAVTPAPQWREQVVGALTGLGWNAKQAGEAVDAVAPAAEAEVDIPTVLRAALRELGR